MLASTVAMNTPLNSIPVLLSIPGFTITMYTIVKNVVIPAMISVETLVPLSFSLNQLFMVKPASNFQIISGLDKTKNPNLRIDCNITVPIFVIRIEQLSLETQKVILISVIT